MPVGNRLQRSQQTQIGVMDSILRFPDQHKNLAKALAEHNLFQQGAAEKTQPTGEKKGRRFVLPVHSFRTHSSNLNLITIGRGRKAKVICPYPKAASILSLERSLKQVKYNTA